VRRRSFTNNQHCKKIALCVPRKGSNDKGPCAEPKTEGKRTQLVWERGEKKTARRKQAETLPTVNKASRWGNLVATTNRPRPRREPYDGTFSKGGEKAKKKKSRANCFAMGWFGPMTSRNDVYAPGEPNPEKR